jgi:cytochrome d ubiquinol oxidase subunit II
MDKLWVLQFLLYAVFLFSIVAYATLDGFDFGVGILHLFTKTDQERRVMINSIGPVWDGNSTWIVVGGGILFAAFPRAFSILAPNLYTPIMAMLFGFMTRAAAIEFRSKRPEKWWRLLWDVVFALASFILAILVGVILGNLIQGVPLDAHGVILGGMGALLAPYPLFIALFGLVTFAMHGSLYLLMKTEGAFHDRMRVWAKRLVLLFVVFWMGATWATFVYQSHMIEPFYRAPYLMVVPLISLAAILGIPQAIRKKADGTAFALSCLSIFSLMLLFVIGTFPNILTSTLNPEQNSLTFMNSAVSELALWVLVIVAGTGIPLSFFYASYIHRVFKGKVKIDSMSY